MTTFFSIFASLAVFVGACLWLCLAMRRGLMVVFAVLMLATLYVATLSLPGEPKSARVELLRSLDGAEILWHGGSETEGLHVLLAGPKLYALPWSERTARALHEASRQAENEGGSFVLREPQDGTPGGEWSAEHRPAEPGPPKT